jgi:type II secretion system protein G
MRKSNQKGFTIIELLVVIVIIGILVALALPQLFAAQARGRDTDRKNNLKNISQQLETYFNDNGEYPAALTGLVPDYMDAIPELPKTGDTYIYTPAGTPPESYTLGTALENANDPDTVGGVYTIESVNQGS